MYAVLSFSYKRLDIALREQIALSQEEFGEFYAKLLGAFPLIQECVLLSTCNRFELILFLETSGQGEQGGSEASHQRAAAGGAAGRGGASGGDLSKSGMADIRALVPWIAAYRHLDAVLLEEGAEFFYGERAMRHLFCVAGSLDSLVVGETQITGQLKEAYKLSYEQGYCGRELTRILHFAFKTAAKIRSQTQISKNPTSIASVAIAHFLRLAPKPHKVIVIGVGEMGRLCVKYLLAQGFEVIVLSRSLHNAQSLKEELGDPRLEVAPLASLHGLINSHAYVFSATGAPHPIITQEMVESRGFRRIWFDLALPRDIQVSQVEGLELFVIDDLQEKVMENKGRRQEEVRKAEGIVDAEVLAFGQWIENLEVEPLIKGFREKAKQCCIDEVHRAIKKGYLPQEMEDEVLRILHNAFNKFLHHPTSYIKTIKEHPESDFVIEKVKALFGLREGEVLRDLYKCPRDSE